MTTFPLQEAVQSLPENRPGPVPQLRFCLCSFLADKCGKSDGEPEKHQQCCQRSAATCQQRRSHKRKDELQSLTSAKQKELEYKR